MPEKIVLVDDVVTKGASLISAAYRIKDQFPNAEIKAFAVARTISQGEIDKILDPICGKIRFTESGSVREP